jgi:hypothetical protein
MKETILIELKQALALLTSYFVEDENDSRFLEAMLSVRCLFAPDIFNRVLVLAQATPDSKFVGGTNVLETLSDLELTDNVEADAERFLSILAEQSAEARLEEERKAAEQSNPFRLAAERLLAKFKQPNLAQVEWELAHL